MDIAVFGFDPTVDELENSLREAAEQGFPSYWMPQIFGMDALTAIAVAAKNVPNIRVGTSVVPTYPRHPMVLAQQALTTQSVIGGRLELGIGLSHQPVVEGMWGISFDKPVRHMSDYLSILTPLLNDRRVSFKGESVIGRGEITPPPADAPPVLVAALGPQMLRLAGRLADGTITWMTGPETIRTLTAPTISEAAEEAGRPAPQVAMGLPVCVTSDVDAARERADRDYAIYGQLPSYRAMLDREGAATPADVAIIGDAGEVADRIRALADCGVTTFAASAFGSSDELAATREVMISLL
ncbi:MAG: LLM class F420-dependent oxidoreductase [Actinomycetota bacterium]|nr:LLM class F420-dependent oxidoreductase [Acidimicrobiaceae bacterium]MEC7434557.1 LLM class F420-dependent oxidoreductase [Actinomycetota bacterium]MEC7579682.1 LLM class F420-dependent oxidoreductase [Actinomycetota bacterium]MEC8522364.1 LLM class F420-dependent oxidoreductase [Actinomycetota bacterium]MED5298104.1 LLM class F420-dependent oxidoreductase [Actinomycetota bacterium]